MCTFPVTSCESERSFSALRRLKTFNRTMSEDSLNGLALMTSHRDIIIDRNRVLDTFVTENPRRMALQNLYH